jgi:hypothetical protein
MAAPLHRATLACAIAAAVVAQSSPPAAQTHSHRQTIAATVPQALRSWDATTTSMLRGGEFAKHLGAGGVLEFTHAPISQGVADRTMGMNAEGVQGGGGIRVGF